MSVEKSKDSLRHAGVLREAAVRITELGAGVLTDTELVAILVGNAESAARFCTSVPLRQLHRVPSEEIAAVQGIGPERLPEPVAVEVHRLERQPCATAPASAASRARGTAPPARRGAPRIQAVEHGRATIR